MSTQDQPALIVLNTQFLSNLDKTQLLDLLTHKTQLLIAARNAGIADPAYSKNLQEELQTIQSVILARKDV